MKKFFTYVCGLAALTLASCASDAPALPDETMNGTDGDVYASLTLSLPTAGGTRAEDVAYDGEEFGQDRENNVGKILVILARKNAEGQYVYLSKAQADAMPTLDSELPANQLKFTLNFKSSELRPNTPLGSGSTLPGSDVYVFVYCNPTANAVDRFGGTQGGNSGFPFDNVFGSLSHRSQGEIWTDNAFMMTNCEVPTAVQLPTRDELTTKHNVPEKAFPLGTVKVKRVCARFDYATSNATNSFTVKSLDGTNEDMGTITLTHMALFNIQKSYYHFAHIADSWNWTVPSESRANYTLCGDLESYVMSYNEDGWKNGDLNDNSYMERYYCNIINNSLSMTGGDNDENQLDWVSISPEDWNKRDADIDEGWPSTGTDYHIWRYCTENTIPQSNSGTATSSQRQGITTGVVFKALFTPTNESVWDGDVIYVHNNIVYGDFVELREYVEKNPTSVVATAFNQVRKFQLAKDTETEDVDRKVNLLDGVSSDTDRHGFKAYPASADGKYYMYYFYFNRHKSNNIESVMGENEFGVVRNNVYKLKVTNIRSLGEPKAPTNPDDPDEKENAYFTVSCIVMPWTVRINNIVF